MFYLAELAVEAAHHGDHLPIGPNWFRVFLEQIGHPPTTTLTADIPRDFARAYIMALHGVHGHQEQTLRTYLSSLSGFKNGASSSSSTDCAR